MHAHTNIRTSCNMPTITINHSSCSGSTETEAHSLVCRAASSVSKKVQIYLIWNLCHRKIKNYVCTCMPWCRADSCVSIMFKFYLILRLCHRKIKNYVGACMSWCLDVYLWDIHIYKCKRLANCMRMTSLIFPASYLSPEYMCICTHTYACAYVCVYVCVY